MRDLIVNYAILPVMKEAVAIGQIGPSSLDFDIGFQSPTGTLPRVLFLEPSPCLPEYSDVNYEYRQTATKAGMTIIEADIYQPFPELNTHPLGLLLLENVVNDPYFPKSKKNIDNLTRNILSVMVQNGLIVFIDSCIIKRSLRPGQYVEQEDGSLYASIYQKMTEQPCRCVLDDGLSGHFVYPPFEGKTILNARRAIIRKLLSRLTIPDEPLTSGIDTAAGNPDASWMVFQKL